jgi:hypothetical protein
VKLFTKNRFFRSIAQPLLSFRRLEPSGFLLLSGMLRYNSSFISDPFKVGFASFQKRDLSISHQITPIRVLGFGPFANKFLGRAGRLIRHKAVPEWKKLPLTVPARENGRIN